MGLISMLFTWPLAPVHGVIRLGELIQQQVEHELRNPAAVRRRLEAIEEARRSDQISEEEEAQAVEEVLRLMSGPRRG
ncbi:gas vesicle protein GvpG [Microbispora bryophytorum]|uniref:Gas vesicle protein GvpG n=1 Tax=Microbispora bryophytorum subsp. camponoti TaxID=1677852 RepID=A0ABR8LCJ8_9ACTN|nr:gas vesicle protein GvpG [Microbispora camponoti]MBD3146244.1 gas vesicle protein GvpG [Microbispora camponoti]